MQLKYQQYPAEDLQLLLSLLSVWMNLGRYIELLKSLGIKIAVITTASLASGVDLRDDLIGLKNVTSGSQQARRYFSALPCI